MTCGIYLIAFGARLYIGSSQRIEQRWNAHRHAFRKGTHHNRFMQRLFEKGVEPVFAVAFTCEADILLAKEQALIDMVCPELNIAVTAGAPMRGRKHSDETRARMSARTDFQDLGLARRGKPGTPCSLEIRQHFRASHPARRTVRCVETNDLFASRADAARWLIARGLAAPGNAASNIGAAARGVLRSAYGYHWISG